jgi:hypothetical protein
LCLARAGATIEAEKDSNMRVALAHLDDRPVEWLCTRGGNGRHAAAAAAALGLGLAAAPLAPGLASACLAVGIVVAADRLHALASRRFGRNPHPGTAAFLDALRDEATDDFWLVRHADGATEAMTPSAFSTFVQGMSKGLRRVLMVFRDREPISNLDAVGEALLGERTALGRRVGLREAALRRAAAASRAERRPMDATLLTAWDDVALTETPALVDPSTGILSPVSLPQGKGTLTQAYLAFENGGEYMLDRLPDGRFAVIDIPTFLADLAPAPAAAG